MTTELLKVTAFVVLATAVFCYLISAAICVIECKKAKENDNGN